VQNVETLANFAWILRNGGEAYASLGFSTSRGTKVVSLNSLFKRPGLYEVELGIPVRAIVEEFGGGLISGELRGVLIGGPLAGLLPPRHLDAPFAFDELRKLGASVGHGGVIAFDERTSILDLLNHVFSFGAYESCGCCTPCRLGSRHIEQMASRADGAPPWDERAFERILSALRETSLCGHGGGLAEFADSVSRYYREELRECLASS
jgi:NADH:ubiquinone oxidoreductase subunit F (NADH-binding)